MLPIHARLIPALTLLCLYGARPLPGQLPWTDQEMAQLSDPARKDRPRPVPEGHAWQSGTSLYFHDWTWVTDDRKAARAMVERSLARSNAAVRKIEATAESAEGFDFRAGRIWYRVHKKSYFDWVDRWVGLSVGEQPTRLGHLGKRPVTLEAARRFVEYEWKLRNDGHVPLRLVAGKPAKDRFRFVAWTLLRSAGDWGLAAQVYAVRVEYEVVAKTGEVRKRQQVVRQIFAQGSEVLPNHRLRTDRRKR